MRQPTSLRVTLVVTCLALLLAASWAVLLPPAIRAWQLDDGLSYESLLREGLPEAGAIAAMENEALADDFIGFLSTYGNGETVDTWLFGAQVIGYLRLHNIPLWEAGVAALFSAGTRDVMVIEEGDTWVSLAQRYAGSPSLWPIVILLNKEWIERRGLELDAGYRVWVPMANRLQGRGEDGDGEVD